MVSKYDRRIFPVFELIPHLHQLNAHWKMGYVPFCIPIMDHKPKMKKYVISFIAFLHFKLNFNSIVMCKTNVKLP